MQTTMIASVLTDFRVVVCKSIDIPKPAVDEVLIKVCNTGVCGSDLSTYEGKHPYKVPPTILGHEYAGTIVEAGPQVTGFKVGDRVCAAAYSNCESCTNCVDGYPHLCLNKRSMSHGGWEGSFAEYVIGRPNKLFRLPDKIGFAAGALIEPLSIGLHALRQSGDVHGKHLAIIGAGNIGLCCAMLARAFGASRIICFDIDQRKRELALSCGADELFINDINENYNYLSSSYNFDNVIVAADYDLALDDAVRIANEKANIVIVSYFSKSICIEANKIVQKELCLKGSALSTESDFNCVIELIMDGQIDPLRMVTHRLNLRQAAEALELMAARDRFNGKVILYADGESLP